MKWNVMRPLCVVALTMAVVPGGATERRATPRGWTMVEAPREDARVCANWTLRSWRVQIGKDAQVEFVTNDELNPPREHVPFPFQCPGDRGERRARLSAVALGTQWLVGCDFGEFGGGLWRTEIDGSRSQRLWNDGIVALTLSGTRILALARDPSLQSSALLEVHTVGDTWAVSTSEEMAGWPVGMLEADAIRVVTSAGVFNVGDTVTKIVDLELDGLMPSSVVAPEEGSLFIGLRHYVLHLRQTGDRWTQEWLAPEGCAAFEKTVTKPCRCSAVTAR